MWSGLSNVARALKEILNSNGVRRHRVINGASSIMEIPATVAWTAGRVSNDAYSVLLDSILAEADTVVAKGTILPPQRPDAKEHNSEPD